MCIIEEIIAIFYYFSIVILFDKDKNCFKLFGGFFLFCFVFFDVDFVNLR